MSDLHVAAASRAIQHHEMEGPIGVVYGEALERVKVALRHALELWLDHTEPIQLGDGCWIAAGAVIGPGADRFEHRSWSLTSEHPWFRWIHAKDPNPLS